MPRILIPNTKKIWMTDTGTYPVIASMLVAVGWCAYMSTRALFASPDVTIDRKERGSLFKDSREMKAISWVEGHQKYKMKDVSKIRIL